jgi:hypothetical protein
MMSTKPSGVLALMASGLLALGVTSPGLCQAPRPREVDLKTRGGEDHWWQVTDSGDRFVAEKHVPKSQPVYRHNFKESADWMQVSGKYMAYDLSGKNKEVLAEKRYTETTQWTKEGGRNGMRLQVRNGALKDWWVGLGPIQEAKPGKRPSARLVLVEDKKDAAEFYWADPRDEGP